MRSECLKSHLKDLWLHQPHHFTMECLPFLMTKVFLNLAVKYSTDN